LQEKQTQRRAQQQTRTGAAGAPEAPAVSVIVPVWNDAACLESLLSWLDGEPGPLEVIVVDGGSRDGSREVARRFPRVRLMESPKGRGRQMNAGAEAARGRVLLFLHSDTYPPRGAVASLPELLDRDRADFGAFRLRFEPPARLPQFLALLTRFRRYWTCYGDQGIFVRRPFFQRTGGYPEVPLLEDVHWLRVAGRLGRMTRCRRPAVTSSRRFAKNGSIRQTWRNFWILIRDLFGQDPHRLAEIYHRGRDPSEQPGRDAAAGAPDSSAPAALTGRHGR